MHIRYSVQPLDVHAHLFSVTLDIPEPATAQEISMPVWIPGSYLVREFARQLRGLKASQQGRAIGARQTDKCTWVLDCEAGARVSVSYSVYAFDPSVRAAWLDASRGFFNGTGLLLRVHGQEDRPHELELVATPATRGWSVATGLGAVKCRRDGFGLYRAADYDELVDCPVELGRFWSGDFTACGVPHRFVVAGATAAFDGERLLADTRRICEAELRLWHGERVGQRGGPRAPMDRYVFMLNAVDDGYGGLEHRNSTALIAKRADLPRLGDTRPNEGYTTLLGLISHEYFHTWNVKRLRPAEFARHDYTRENYTRLLWFFEGFTSYYDDLVLRRAGLIDDAGYLKLLQKTINQVQQTPGRQVQSVAQASFDAWTRYYRPDEGTPNGTVSYYTKGALVALAFDLSLRAQGGCTLDDVMRGLWQRCAGGPMSEDDFLAELQSRGGRSMRRELRQWVHGTGELPLLALLEARGVGVIQEPAPLAQRLGLRVNETGGTVRITHVLDGGAAHAAGLSAGDEWLGVETGSEAWRLTRLDDLPLLAGRARGVTALVSRDRRILRCKLRIDARSQAWRLVSRDAARLKAWLDG